jgi:hypothetical protein
MASLSGQNPSATFPSLIKTINNNPVTGLVQLSDGNGTGLPISISATNVSVNSPLTASIISATNNGNGTNFKIGDDVFLGDVNIANTFQVMGQEDATQGFIKFGSGSNSAIVGGVAGSNVFQVTGSVAVSTVLSLKPQSPLPAASSAPYSFAVSASTPAKPYFSDGTNWNALY